MQKQLRILAGCLLVGTLIFAIPVVAQDSDPTCDIPAITAEFSERIGEAADLETLQEVQSELASALAGCSGLAFTGTQGEVIGPIEVPAGIYIIKLDDAAVEFQTLDGDCDDPFMSTGTGDNEGIFNSEGCLTLIDVELRDGDTWTIEFELIRSAE